MMETAERDTRLEVPHDHAEPGIVFGCPGCIRAVKVAEYRHRCEQMNDDDLIDASSMESVPWSWHDRVADEVLERRWGARKNDDAPATSTEAE